MDETQKKILFKSRDDIKAAQRALSARQDDLNNSMTIVLDFLVPEANRRTGQARRSGLDRRGEREGTDAERRKRSDRRAGADRRQPPYERLRFLRRELEQVLQLQDLVNGWRDTISA